MVLVMELDKNMTNSRVLVISENKKDFYDLENVGLNKVDYFKSIVNACRFFKQNEFLLGQYDFIFLGPSWADYYTNGEYKSYIKSLIHDHEVIVLDYEQENGLKDQKILADDKSFSNIYEYFCYVWNNISTKYLEKVKKKERVRFRIRKEHKKVLSMPKELRNVRMLFYVREEHLEEVKNYVRNLGFEYVDFYTYRFGDLYVDNKFLVENLSSYDIVVLPSSGHLRLENEAMQQMIEKGRSIVSFVYAHKDNYCDGLYDERVTMDFVMAQKGVLQHDYWYRMIGTGQELNREFALFNTILSEYAMFLKENKLANYDILGLNDIDYYDNLVAEYRHEQQLVLLKEYERKNRIDMNEIKKINEYDNLVAKINKFLEYQEIGIVRKTPELCFKKKENGIEVTIYTQGKISERMFIFNDGFREDLRLLWLQYSLNKNGKFQLTEPKEIGIYTCFWDEKCSVPRMDESEEIIFYDMLKRIDIVLSSVLDDLEGKNKVKSIYSLKKKKRRK